MAVTLTVILGKNTFYDVRDMRFVRLKQYDEILQGTVACTDIHTADILPDGLFHLRNLHAQGNAQAGLHVRVHVDGLRSAEYQRVNGAPVDISGQYDLVAFFAAG